MARLAAVGDREEQKMIEGDQRRAEMTVQKIVAEAIVGIDMTVAVATEIVAGDASQLLLESAVDADVLVVGSRGRGGFKGVLLGSVSQRVAQHAPCPLVIVPS